jgi:hypothetical protein
MAMTSAGTMNEDDQLREIARGNIERHLGDCENADEIYENALTLATDALLDAGVERSKAQSIALELAMCYAAP